MNETEYIFNAEKSFIGAWYIDDIDLCDELIDFFENNEKKHKGLSFLHGKPSVDITKKDSTDLSSTLEEDIIVRYQYQLQEIIDQYTNLYPHSANTTRWEVEGINIQKYDPSSNGYPAWHCERAGWNNHTIWRHLVFMTYLNTIDNEGETEFAIQKIKIKPRKGLTLIWPADWTHYHRGIASPTETKYIITGWLSFVDQNIVKEHL